MFRPVSYTHLIIIILNGKCQYWICTQYFTDDEERKDRTEKTRGDNHSPKAIAKIEDGARVLYATSEHIHAILLIMAADCTFSKSFLPIARVLGNMRYFHNARTSAMRGRMSHDDKLALRRCTKCCGS